MSAVSKPGLKPIDGAVSSSKTAATGAKKLDPKETSGLDQLEGKKAGGTSKLNGPAKVVAPPTVEGIAETFPLQALSKLEAKGVGGQTFLLDGGSLRGLKLEARRVRDGEAEGFEIVFQLTPAKLAPLLEAMKKQEAVATRLEFREIVLGEDGIAKFGKGRGQVTASTHNAASDQDNDHDKWVLRLEGKKGGTIEVVHDKAALAVRGFVRINLRGDDATCTKQLDGLVKSLGLAALFSPPTSKSKQLHALMRVLWQVDNAKAEALSKGDLDKLKVEDVKTALLAAGYSEERIAGLRYEEVYKGHFTVVDPGQAAAMAQAGARYLYSTVQEPAHVHSILLHGQKASFERYKDGLIIDGMSSNSDFATGGAVGVFTRLVTQDAIYGGKSWTGRTYKLLQTHEQLGRTDWHGWNGDYFGRRWDLKSDTNFGVGLVKQIGNNGTYASSNELIFPAGNRPENILRVIATTEDARLKLIDLLKKEGYVPHNGLPLEEFVVLSPKFLLFGKSPYQVDDPAAFIEQAKAKAGEGDLGPLTWFLAEGPEAPELRRALEREILLGQDAKAQNAVFLAAKLRGPLALGQQFDEVITELEARGDAGSAILQRLAREAAESLFRSGSSKALHLLLARKDGESSSHQPYGLESDDYVRILNALVGASGEIEKKLFDLAVEVRAPRLLSDKHPGFLAFLAKHPLVKPEDPIAFINAEVQKLKEDNRAAQLRLFAAQKLEPEVRRHLEAELIRADHSNAQALLRTLIEPQFQLALDGEGLKGLIDALPEASATRSYLLGQAQDALLKYCHQGLFELVVQRHPNRHDLGVYDQQRWQAVAEAIVPPPGSPISDLGRRILEHGGPTLVASDDFIKKLRTLPGLYDFTTPELFFKDALENLSGRGQLQFAYLFTGPDMVAPHRLAGVKHLLQNKGHEAQRCLERSVAWSGQTRLPITADERNGLVKELAAEPDRVALFRLLRIDGKNVLEQGTSEVATTLEQTFKEDPNPLARFDLSGAGLIETMEKVRSREDEAGAQIYSWILRAGAKSFLRNNDKSFIAHLEAQKASLEQLGLTPADAAVQIGQAVDTHKFYYTSSSYSSYAEYQKLPAGAEWLLMQGESTPDPKVLEAVEAALPSWNWSEPLLAEVMKRVPDLSDEWKSRLQAARVKQ